MDKNLVHESLTHIKPTHLNPPTHTPIPPRTTSSTNYYTHPFRFGFLRVVCVWGLYVKRDIFRDFLWKATHKSSTSLIRSHYIMKFMKLLHISYKKKCVSKDPWCNIPSTYTWTCWFIKTAQWCNVPVHKHLFHMYEKGFCTPDQFCDCLCIFFSYITWQVRYVSCKGNILRKL